MLIIIGKIAGMEISVMPWFIRRFVVFVITHKQADRTAGDPRLWAFGLHANFTCSSCGYFVAIRVKKRHVITGDPHTHWAGVRFGEWVKRSAADSCFRLPETFIYIQPGHGFPFFEKVLTQSLARRSAVFKAWKIIRRHVLVHYKAVHCRRSAKTCYAIFFYNF